MKIDKTLKIAVAGTALGLFSIAGTAWADNHEAKTTYKFGGYVKFDSMFSDYSDGTPSGNDLIRQFYFAPQVPVGDGSAALVGGPAMVPATLDGMLILQMFVFAHVLCVSSPPASFVYFFSQKRRGCQP